MLAKTLMPLNGLHPFLLQSLTDYINDYLVSMPLNGLHPFLSDKDTNTEFDIECVNAL